MLEVICRGGLPFGVHLCLGNKSSKFVSGMGRKSLPKGQSCLALWFKALSGPCKGRCTWVLPRFYGCCHIVQVKYVTILCFTPFSWISFLYPFKCIICVSAVINFWFFITVTTPPMTGRGPLKEGEGNWDFFSRAPFHGYLFACTEIVITWKVLPLPWRTQEDFLSDHCWSNLGSSAWKKQNGLWRPGNLCGVLVLCIDDARGIWVIGLTCLPSVCCLNKVEWFI